MTSAKGICNTIECSFSTRHLAVHIFPSQSSLSILFQ